MCRISETVRYLKSKGYITEFKLNSSFLESSSTSIRLSTEDFTIDLVFQFDSYLNPNDEAIIYAISSKRFGIKGLFLDTYTENCQPVSLQMIEKLSYNSEM